MSELVQAALVIVIAVATVLYLLSRQRKQSAEVLSRLQPHGQAKEKRSKPRPEFKTYTRAEVALHNKAEDAWVIIRDKRDKQLKVYDVTEYVDEHPGGNSILNNVGGEATEGFHGPQHPDAVFEMVKTYLIGKIDE